MKQILVVIEESGEVRIDATGFKGSACEKATAEIEKALGITTGKGKVKKPEYFQGQQAGQTLGH